MKKITVLFFIIFILGLNLLPLKVLASGDGFSCVCSNGTCTEYTTQAETDLKCKSIDKIICKGYGGDCSNKGATTVPTTTSGTVAQDPKILYTKLDNPLGSVKTPTDILGRVIQVAMGIMGGAVLLMVVKGSVTWIDAGGNSEKIESGTKTILWALLGAVITVVSYVVLKGIVDAFFHPLGQ